MGLSPDIVRAHIDHWESRLSKGNRGYRRYWPAQLFRHEPLENAAQVLRSGVLLSRRHAAGSIVRDIAPTSIISSRTTAYDAVRLYFRPKSPTQYHIEGISKPTELYEGRQAQALVILRFLSEDILTQPGVEFSDGNMQSPQTVTGSTDEEFQALPFNLIFHEGSYDHHSGVGPEIVRRRCAEVLVPSPLLLQGNLHSIVCRSPAERATLLHLLGDLADEWSDRIRVFTAPGLFESRYAYMNTVDGGPDGVAFTLNPRRDSASVATMMQVWDSGGDQCMHFGPQELDPAKRWVSRKSLEPGTYLARFELEGCLAYKAKFMVEEMPF